jgi:hypothetical protein
VSTDGANVRDDDGADLEPGDLWIFTSPGDEPVRRVALVLDSDVKACSVTAALVSPDVDFAADRDLVLADDLTGAGYPLMIETGFVATLHWYRAQQRVGMLSNELVDDIVDFIWSDRPAALEELRGHPWAEPSHAERAAFEEDELADLIALARESDDRFGGAPPKPAAGFAAACAVVSDCSSADQAFALDLLDGIQAGRIRHAECLEDGVLGPLPFLEGLQPSPSATLSDLRGLMQPLVDQCLHFAPAVVRDVDTPSGSRLTVHIWASQTAPENQDDDESDDAVMVFAPHLAAKYGPILRTADDGPVLLGGFRDG